MTFLSPNQTSQCRIFYKTSICQSDQKDTVSLPVVTYWRGCSLVNCHGNHNGAGAPASRWETPTSPPEINWVCKGATENSFLSKVSNQWLQSHPVSSFVTQHPHAKPSRDFTRRWSTPVSSHTPSEAAGGGGMAITSQLQLQLQLQLVRKLFCHLKRYAQK